MTACFVAAAAVTTGVVASAATPASAPVITQQPQPATVMLGRLARFTVKATGSPRPAYQWQVSSDGGAFTDTDTTTSTLAVTASTSDDGSVYRAVASNSTGSVVSQTAALTVAVSPKMASVKPLIIGLIDKGSQQPYETGVPFPVTDTAEVATDPDTFAGIVVNVSWAQLEPSQGQWDFAPLNASLAAVSAYNAANSSDPLAVKLRVWGGYTAPAWAKQIDGAPISVPGDSQRPAGGTLGRYWSADYEQQWTDLQDALAKQYDADALVREVAVTSCNTASAEPFVMDGTAIAALTAAGWTSADQQSCLDGALGNYSAWHKTAVDFTFNTFSDVSATGTRSPDFSVTADIMSECAASEITGDLPLCILDNHGLTDTVTTQQSPVYDEIDSLWQQYGHDVPVDFQTISPNGFDLCEAVGVAIAHHAQSVEIWPPGTGFTGFDEYTPAQLASWSAALVDGVVPSCS